jgi:hypothetical protein
LNEASAATLSCEGINRVVLSDGHAREIDPNMILQPRSNPYVRSDGWDEEAQKGLTRKVEATKELAKAA